MSRRRWRLLAVVALLALIGTGGWLVGIHLWANHHLRAARAALESYHDEEARSHLEACLKVWPRNPEVLLLAARAARRAGAYEVAGRFLDRYQDIRGSDDELVLERMLLKAEQGEFKAVGAFCRARIAQNHPTAPLVFEALARGLLRAFRLQEAETILGDWLRQQPDNPQAHFYLAIVFERTERLADALATYRRAVEIDPQRDDLRERLAVLLLRMGSADDALPHLEYLLRRHAETPQLQVHLAHCRALQGDRRAAEQLLDEVLARRPDFAPALAERGQLAAQAGQRERAEDLLRRAVKGDPGDYAGRYQFYQCLLRNGRAEEAERERARLQIMQHDNLRHQKILTTEMQQRPNDLNLHCEVGEIDLRLGSLEEARRWFQTALKQDPSHARAHRGLAEFYQRVGNPGLAARHRSLASGAGLPGERRHSPPPSDDRRDRPGGSR